MFAINMTNYTVAEGLSSRSHVAKPRKWIFRAEKGRFEKETGLKSDNR